MTEQSSVYSRLLQLEREARHAETEDALRFVLVNQTRRLVAYRQAVLVRLEGPGRFAVEAVSNVPVIDRDAPFVRWLTRVLKTLRPDQPPTTDAAAAAQASGEPGSQRLDAAALPEALRAEWSEWWPPEVLWQPLKGADGRLLGGLMLAREEPFQSAEQVLADRLADAYGHAWEALRRRLGLKVSAGQKRRRRTVLAWAAALIVVTVLAWPVRQSALAPSEVVPMEPQVVAAPLEGVVETVLVDPNQAVEAGQPLFRFEEAPLRARREVAAKQLAVAEADLRQARQSAFRSPARKGEVALKEAAVDLRRAELAYAEELLSRAVVSAPAAGVAVFADKDDWTGRPVAVGERVMVVADPERTKLRAWLPVSDAIALEPGTDVRVFLAVDPLNPVPAILNRASYDAELTPEGTLAYRVDATFLDRSAPRIGLQGTAKLYGEHAPLAFTLFRRPIASIRQFLGL